ncbi:hypothetical protein RHS01_04748 [Rhizoctonia solani]|uniref:Transmembrane protein n=1 Tax=Rhizoctonia solani TaxID=456999 RepID=A0A8H7ICH2_9AGAM|nr:hypothetical protein RHS01_04748 [Rhizoctonia solani]
MTWPTFHTEEPIKELVVKDADMKLATLAFGWTFWLKFTIAVWITAINISVYCIWVPAKLQISQRYHDINVWWDRTEKCLYLVTDAILNYMFIRSIKQRLLKVGLKKYDKLVKFNEKIIAVSLAMDVLIITMMSHPNDFVYMQFHPVAYMVKLEIEMCMSKLMIKVATGTGIMVYEGEALDPSTSKSSKERGEQNTNQFVRTGQSVNIQVATHTVTHTDQSENGRVNNDVVPIQRTGITIRTTEATPPNALRSWIEEPSYTPSSGKQLSGSTITIKDPDVDIERGDTGSDEDDIEPTGGVTMTYLGAFPNLNKT